MQPLLLGSAVRDDNLTLSVDLTNPDIYRDGHIVLPRTRSISCAPSISGAASRISASMCRTTATKPVDFTLSLVFGCDFSDLFEVRGMRREKRGTMTEPVEAPTRVAFTYTGLDDLQRRRRAAFEPAPPRLVAWRRDLRPVARGRRQPDHHLRGRMLTASLAATPDGFLKGFMAANRHEKALTRGVATVETSNEILNEVMCRSTADLYMLITDTPQGLYPYAGIPWYSTTFGRDGIITAIQMLWCDPEVAKGVLARLAHFQAKDFDAAADAEPGKILHEMRGGEMAALREVPFGLYYGTIDSTPLFIVLAGLYSRAHRRPRDHPGPLARDRAGLRLDGRAGRPRRRRVPRICPGRRERPAEPGLEGFPRRGLPCRRRAGRRADRARRGAGLRLCGAPTMAPGWRDGSRRRRAGRDLDAQAEVLRDKVRRRLLVRGHRHLRDRARRRQEALPRADLECRPGALDRDRQAGPRRARRRPSSSRRTSSPAGASAPWRWASRATIRCPTTTARSGRTTTRSSPGAGALRPDGRRPSASSRRCSPRRAIWTLRRLPELFCGFRRRRGAAPTLYPVACAPQAWAAGTPFLLLQACLGLEFDPASRAIRFRNPRLPSFADEITLRNLGFDDAKVDVTLRQVGDHVALRVLRNTGAVQVSMLLD